MRFIIFYTFIFQTVDDAMARTKTKGYSYGNLTRLIPSR